MSKKQYEKIDLPIDVVDFTPGKPDIKWGAIMIGTIVGFFAFAFIVFHLFSNLVVANISIEQEKKLFSFIGFETEEFQNFSEYYTFHKKIPEFEQYNIHVSNEEEENAFAFIGGNIVITKGLIEKAKYEEEIMFVLAHEIGHVLSRHNLKSLARDLPFKMTLFFLGFDIDLGLTNFSNAAINAFSRDAENQSDEIAIKMLQDNGLNPYCASLFFEEMHDSPLEFMSTHPSNDKRIENIKNGGTGKTDFSDCHKTKKEEI